MIDGRVKLISITHIPTNGVSLNPLQRSDVSQMHTALPICSMLVSLGQLPVNVGEIGCDIPFRHRP